VDELADSRSQAEEDASKAWLLAGNCLLYENDRGPELLNVGTGLKPLDVPRSQAWQLSYSMSVLIECNGDHARLLAARQACAEHPDDEHREWSRAVDLCDQALRMIEGAGAVNDDRARQILLAVCRYETKRPAWGIVPGPEVDTRILTEALRKVDATMEDVPSAETLVSWAFPWL
jgi:hypothetical protein